MKSSAAVIAIFFFVAGGVYAMGHIQSSARQLVLVPGVEQTLPDWNLTLSFERVVEDSRCPTGTRCIWEGDAAVMIQLGNPGDAMKSRYTLHTSKRFLQETEHGDYRVRLVAVTPHPAADVPIPPQDYRVTLSVEQKSGR